MMQPQQQLHVTTCASPLGRLLVATSDCGVTAVLLGDDDAELRDDLQRRFPGASLLPADDAARRAASAVVAMIGSSAGTARNARGTPRDQDALAAGMSREIPLDLRGTEFQRAVWAALRDIPRGSTTTYSELAARIGRPTAVRAVAQACAANAHAVLIPCHRVVRSDGGLSGYRWGVERKRTLLREEGAAPR